MMEKSVKASSVETEAGLQQKELNALRSCTKTKSSYAYLLYWKFMQILYQQDIWLYLIPIKTSLVFTSGRIWCKSPCQHTSIYSSCKLHWFFIRVWTLPPYIQMRLKWSSIVFLFSSRKVKIDWLNMIISFYCDIRLMYEVGLEPCWVPHLEVQMLITSLEIDQRLMIVARLVTVVDWRL